MPQLHPPTANAGQPSAASVNPVDVVGVDGWREGWVAAVLTAGTRPTVTWRTHATFAELLDTYPDARVGIDIPIGLSADGPRECDLAARRFLGRAGSSIFPAPRRELVERWRRDPAYPRDLAPGRGVSRQTWGIVAKIAEVDDELRRRGPGTQARVGEVHPESSFRMLAERAGLTDRLDSKKTGRGAGQRLDLLRGWADLPPLADAPPRVPLDDLLDATAAAWSTQRWAQHRPGPETGDPGGVIVFGDAAVDEFGLPQRIIV